MPHITLLAFKDCAASGVFGVIDAFGIANRYHPQLNRDADGAPTLFSWDIVSIDGKPVQGEGRVTITPHCSIDDVNATDVIMIPGFLSPLNFIGRVPKKLTEWIKRYHSNHVMICSTCTGTFFLAETGLLNGRTVTTNLKFSRYFQKLYPSVNLQPERILTEDSGFICSGATTSYMDLCVYLIEKFGFEDLAAICAKALLVEPRRSQSPYFIFDYQKYHTDATIKKAQCFMEEKFTQPISVEELASDFGISQRHFMRRFKRATGDSPLRYLQRIRIEAAKEKLEKTMQSIDEITQQVGYEDTNSFRKLFKKYTGLSPRNYRNRFTRLLKPVPVN